MILIDFSSCHATRVGWAQTKRDVFVDDVNRKCVQQSPSKKIAEVIILSHCNCSVHVYPVNLLDNSFKGIIVYQFSNWNDDEKIGACPRDGVM